MSEILKDQNGNTSSKRVAGFICGGVGLLGLTVLGVASMKYKIADPTTAMEAFKNILYVSGFLLGVGVAEHFGGKK